MRELAAEKYRQTHDYDPVAGRYYDNEKELNFVRTREELESLQGQAQRNRLPPSVRYGEGNEYDIISKEVGQILTARISGHGYRLDAILKPIIVAGKGLQMDSMT